MMPAHLTTIEQTLQMMSMHTGAHRAAEARVAREARETTGHTTHIRGLKIEPPKLTMSLTAQEWDRWSLSWGRFKRLSQLPGSVVVELVTVATNDGWGRDTSQTDEVLLPALINWL